MDEVEALKRKVKLMESVFANLETKTVSVELNRIAKNKVRVLNLINLLNLVSETKIDNTIYQEYIEYAKQIKGKMYDERKKQVIANVSAASGTDSGEASPIGYFSYKIIDGNKVEITELNHKFAHYIKIPDTINGLPVTSIGYGAFQSSSINKLVLPNSLVNIEQFAFEFSSINKIILPNNLLIIKNGCFEVFTTSFLKLNDGLKVIESNAFKEATIKMVKIPSSVNFIGSEAFFTKNNIHILFEYNENENGLVDFENAFPPDAVLYTKNITLLNKLKEYKTTHRKCWDISDNVDEFELEWLVYDKFEKAKGN